MGLRTKPVYRNKEETITLGGLPLSMAIALGASVIVIGYVWGLFRGLTIGGLGYVACYALVAGRPPFWLSYIAIYLVRRWTVVAPAAPAPVRVLAELDRARSRYEQR